jgi:hypothetical protein
VVVDGISAPDVGAVMFGLVGFRVLAAGVIGGELELQGDRPCGGRTSRCSYPR